MNNQPKRATPKHRKGNKRIKIYNGQKQTIRPLQQIPFINTQIRQFDP